MFSNVIAAMFINEARDIAFGKFLLFLVLTTRRSFSAQQDVYIKLGCTKQNCFMIISFVERLVVLIPEYNGFFLARCLPTPSFSAMARAHICSLYMYNGTSSTPFGIHTLILCIHPCAANGTCILKVIVKMKMNKSHCQGGGSLVMLLQLTSSRCGSCTCFFWTKL